jgi:L-serine dehydratase
MGPYKAAMSFKAKYPDADSYKAILFGSLAMTGAGHMTDKVICEAFEPKKCEVVFDKTTPTEIHPNTMCLKAYSDGSEIGNQIFYSIGGGSILTDGESRVETVDIYPHNNFSEIAEYCNKHNMRIPDYVEMVEGKEIWNYLSKIWLTMKQSVDLGLCAEGTLGGGLHVTRKARVLFQQRHIDESAQTRENRIVCAYAFAVSEQNAGGGEIVTAPTCGSCGVLPSVLKYMQDQKHFSDEQILRALATGGVIGNIIKKNASISGAECGCQAEIGSACAMASAALAELFELSIDKIEYAAEIAIEHHLGLTCDPICGLVQIPCIERNAVAAMRAINAVNLASFLWDSRKISFDKVVQTMKETGHDLSASYKETSEAGLAKINL